MDMDLTSLLDRSTPGSGTDGYLDFVIERVEDPKVAELLNFIVHDQMPQGVVFGPTRLESLLSILDVILYYVNPKYGNRKRAVVPRKLQQQILEQAHSAPLQDISQGSASLIRLC